MQNSIKRAWIVAAVAFATASLTGCAALPPIAVTPDSSPPADPHATTAATAAPASALAPHKVDGGWLFSYRAAAAQSIAVAGDFNAWSTSANVMVKGGGDVWSVVVPLTAGDHQYKFVVNGSDWKPDPENAKSSDDGYGGKNSLVHVE